MHRVSRNRMPTKKFELGSTGGIEVRRVISVQHARKSAPSTGGVKKPSMGPLTAWGADADLVFRLRLLQLAKEIAKRDEAKAHKVHKKAYSGLSSELKHGLEQWEEASSSPKQAEVKLPMEITRAITESG